MVHRRKFWEAQAKATWAAFCIVLPELAVSQQIRLHKVLEAQREEWSERTGKQFKPHAFKL